MPLVNTSFRKRSYTFIFLNTDEFLNALRLNEEIRRGKNVYFPRLLH